MTLAPGARLGEYEILGPLGAGGMGQVWRARDTKLGRDVALKLLPEAFAEDRERLSRFRREAQLLASLNHPSIAAIYGLEEAEGRPFLALELVEGEDLARRLARGAIPRDEALELALQIAEALEEAHGKGIVHRDLKPGNVMITPGGRVKVLDFGLAKACAADPGSGTTSSDLSHSPTIERSGTLAGVILGTAAYMSPEQASGKAVDRRTDIWSFGVVLFEMLTGRSLFTGETPSEILAAVIKEEPPWTLLPRDCPPAVVTLLRRCLRKRPRERLQDIGDARLEIADVLQGASEGAASAPGVEAAREIQRRRLRERWAWAAAALLGALALLIGLRQYSKAPEARSAVRFALDTPEGLSLDAPLLILNVNIPAISPDGRSVVYVGVPAAGGSPALWIASLGSGETRPLAGTEGALMPFWSPDGAWVAFFAPDGVRKIRLADGSMERILSIPAALAGGGSWSNGGTILFSVGPNGRIQSVPAGGGEVKTLTRPDESRKETGHWWPQFLPDGRHFLFTVSGQSENAGLYVSSLDSPNERRRILPQSVRAVYAAPGCLLFLRDKQVLAQGFDAERLATKGDAVPIARSVASAVESGWGWFSASTNGRLAFVSEGIAESDTELVWLDRKGERLGAVGTPAQYGQIVLSPDGKKVAVEIPDAKGRNDLWVVDLGRGVSSRVTADPAGEWDPVWSLDGGELVFGSDRNGTRDLFRKNLQTNGPELPLLRSSVDKFPESWSPDGKTLLYVTAAEGHQGVWALAPATAAEPELILENGFSIDEPQVSPDGRWLAYTSVDSGEWEVYVQPFRRPGERVRLSIGGGGQPKWRADGRELFYLARDGRVTAVGIKSSGPALEVGLPAPLFSIGSFRPDYDDYAPAADGQRFLVKVPVEKRPRRIHVVVDWPSLLRPGS